MKKLLSTLLALTLLLALAPMALAVWETYPVEGGNIYIDWSTNTVTLADSTVTSANIPADISSIGEFAFSHSALANITIPDTVTSIGDGAFTYCSSLTAVTIPASVTSIGASAFNACFGLTSVTIPNGVTSIEDMTFNRCTSLTSVTIPTSVTSIGMGAFRGCSALANVTIPDGVTSIGESAFSDCTGLTSVTIPAGVTSIGESAFYNCSSLTDIYFAGSEAQWNEAIKDSYDVYDASKVTVHFNSAAPTAGFTDVDSVYVPAVKWATGNNFADARSATTFGASDPCPRWEVISILWKAMDSPEPTITSVPFTDVSADAPYYDAILWAYENNIAKGNSATTFGTNDTVMRRDAMTFIYRAAGGPAVEAATSFNDVPAGEYYTAPIAWAASNGIANGTGSNNFSPDAPVTRAQMVTFLYRWLNESTTL